MYPKSEIDEKLGKFRTVSSTARSLSGLEREPQTTEDCTRHDQNLTSSDEQLTPSRKISSGSLNCQGSVTSQQSTSLPYVELSTESVNYLGYYSSHEQLMQQLILDKASETQKHIKSMVAKGKLFIFSVLSSNMFSFRYDRLPYSLTLEQTDFSTR